MKAATSTPVTPRMVALVLPLLAPTHAADPTDRGTQPWRGAKVLVESVKFHPTTWHNVLIGRNPPSLHHWLLLKSHLGKLDEFDAALLAEIGRAHV